MKNGFGKTEAYEKTIPHSSFLIINSFSVSFGSAEALFPPPLPFPLLQLRFPFNIIIHKDVFAIENSVSEEGEPFPKNHHAASAIEEHV